MVPSHESLGLSTSPQSPASVWLRCCRRNALTAPVRVAPTTTICGFTRQSFCKPCLGRSSGRPVGRDLAIATCAFAGVVGEKARKRGRVKGRVQGNGYVMYLSCPPKGALQDGQSFVRSPPKTHCIGAINSARVGPHHLEGLC